MAANGRTVAANELFRGVERVEPAHEAHRDRGAATRFLQSRPVYIRQAGDAQPLGYRTTILSESAGRSKIIPSSVSSAPGGRSRRKIRFMIVPGGGGTRW